MSLIESNNGCGLYYFNRLVGYEEGNSIKSLSVYDKLYKEVCTVYHDSTKFIEDNFGELLLCLLLCLIVQYGKLA